MNEIIADIIAIVFMTVIVPLLSYLGTLLINYLKTKIKKCSADDYNCIACEIVLKAVRNVFQTYVEELKKNKSFDKEAQAIALEKARAIAKDQMTEELKAFITNLYGDYDKWLDTEIEASINILKKK